MKLSDQLEERFRLDQNQKKALYRLHIFTVADLLFHFPVRYSDISEVKNIIDLAPGDIATVCGKISGLKTKKAFRSKIPMAEGEIADLTGKIKIIWFNQAYLAKMVKNGETVKLTGKVTRGKGSTYLANPEFEKVPHMPIDTHDSLFGKDSPATLGFSYPIYGETRGITSKWFYHAIEKIFREKTQDEIQDHIPEEILKKYHLPALKTALVWIHKPKNKDHAKSARKRFAFEEVFSIQLRRQKDKFEYKKNKSFHINTNKKDIDNFISRFPFKPTDSQKKAVETILEDMRKSSPMSRLLEGDVGSGKTAVAATVSHAVVNTRPFDHSQSKTQTFGNLQVAYMAPTEILATQHFESFIELLKGMPINIGLITGSGCRKFPAKTIGSTQNATWTNISRAQLLKWVANGEIPILIGTHTLIQKTVKFKNLAFVVIDEQHRFGTDQRRKLVRKDHTAPHLLSMTATPIPRTLALTIYGDLDLSLLSEMPLGRKQIITQIITPNKRNETYEKIREEIKAGRQAFVICPRIEEGEVANTSRSLGRSDDDGQRKFSTENFRAERSVRDEATLNMKSVIAEAKRLKKKVFPEYEVGILHSKMSKEKKEKVMKDFSDGKINILCATSVVEVGVNVPNATSIIIEGAERFGLAQLHQLRGRVIRSSHQAYCYVFADAKNEKTMNRLKALITAKNGFELAELDLSLRGAGELGGGKQWGITDLGMEAIKNIKMVEAARAEAVHLIETDPELSKYPLLKEKIKEKENNLHFE